MPKLYKNSPIIEAACGFSFDQETSWNATIPGRLYEKLKDDYPQIRQLQDFEAVMEAAKNEVHQRVVQINRTQFVSSDGGSIVQVQPFALSVNRTAPYTNWADFLPKIKKGLTTYIETASPSKLRGIQLQYQNRIVLPGPGPLVWPEELFNFHYVVPADLGGKDAVLSGFLVGIQIPFDDGVNQLKLQLSNLPSEDPDSVAFLLQIVYEVAAPGGILFEDIDQWLDNAHDRVEKAFESSISNTLRAQFEEVKHDNTQS